MTGSVEHWTRRGVLGAMITFGGLAVLWALAVPLFGPSDEAGHVSYGLALVRGDLPVAGTRTGPAFAGLGQESTLMFIATHPPLYYAVSGPLAWIAQQGGHPAPFLYGVRLLNVALVVATIGVVARLAGTVVRTADPRLRAAVVVVAAGLTATLPSLVSAAGSIYNDALAVLVATVGLLVLARAVRDGLTGRGVALLAALAAACLLTRVALLPLALAVVAAVAVLTVWPGMRPCRPTGRDVGRGLARGGAVAAAVALGAGWFYLLNRQRYGDAMGSSVLYPGVMHRPWAAGAEDGAVSYLLQPHAVWTQLRQLGGLPARLLGDESSLHDVLGATMGLSLLVGLVAVVVGAARGRRMLDGQGRWILLGLVAMLLAAWLELGSHVAHKGTENNRYLLIGLAGWAVGGALVLVAARWRGFPPLAPVLLVGGAVGSVAGTASFARSELPGPGGWWSALVEGLTAAGIPGPAVVLVLLLATVVAGLTLQLAALVGIAGAADADPARAQPPATPYSRSPASPSPGTM